MTDAGNNRLEAGMSQQPASDSELHEEFEVFEHQIPWFLWLFFILIICWASISWVPMFGY